MLKRFAFVLVFAACGGGGQKAVSQEPTSQTMVATKSECAVMADHAAGVVLTFKDPPKAPKDELAKVIETHCEADAWSADAKQCWAALATEDDARKCMKLLSEEQHDKVMADFKARYGHDHDEGKGTKMHLEEGKMGKRAPDGAPPPAEPAPPPPPASTRGPAAPAPARAPAPKAPAKKAPVKSNDPCEGGE